MLRGALYLLCSLAIVTAAALAMRIEEPPGDRPPAAQHADVDDWVCPKGTPGTVTCAYVAVPEDYSDPEIRNVRLFTARITPPLGGDGDPIVFVGQGLGVASVSDFGDWQRVARTLGREIVLVDLRASGRSEPRLNCPETRGDEWLQADLTGAALDNALDSVAVALAACRDRLAADIPLEAYSLDAMAHDLDIVRERLGIDQWTIIAGGGAAMVARLTEQQYGDGVASLVLLGAVRSSASRTHTARYEFASEMLADTIGPELSERLVDAADLLEARSIVFPVQSSGQARRVAISQGVVHPIIARALADAEFRSGVEAFISNRLDDEQWRVLALLRDRQQRTIATTSLPVRLAVLCGDPSMADADPEAPSDSVHDPLWTGLFDDPTFDAALCDVWPATEHEGLGDEPSSPTLVVNGEFDVDAPRAAAEEIAAAWPSAEVATLDDAGRPSLFDDCTAGLIQAFLASGDPKLDEVCA